MVTTEKDHKRIVGSIAPRLRAILGPDVVLVSEEERSLHSYDAWPVASKWKLEGKRPYAPDFVVRPKDVAQVQELIKFAGKNRLAITPWGLGSSVTGACLPLHRGVTLDMSALNRTISIDETNLVVTVEAGKRGSDLEQELNARGFTLGNSPQSLDRSSIGGWVSTRETGQFSSLYGAIEDLAVRFTVVLASGEEVETAYAPRCAIGPDLRHVFMGAEGCMGIITTVTLKMFPLPAYRSIQAIQFASVPAGLAAMQSMMQSRLRPFLVRFYDQDEARHAMKDPQFNDCVLFLGFEGHQTVVEAEYAIAYDFVRPNGGVELGPGPVEAWMQRRFDFSAIEERLAQTGGLAETIEIAHFWSDIYSTYRDLKSALAPYADEVLGHFSHVYPQGTSLYLILLGRTSSDADAKTAIMSAWNSAMSICNNRRAAISHHHGIGIVRLPYIAAGLGKAKRVLDGMKQALDPQRLLNPGKLGLEPAVR